MGGTLIGRVTATESNPTTCNLVRFWVHRDVLVRPFDIVRIEHIGREAARNNSHTYALVQELRYMTDSSSHLANYVSHDFGDVASDPQNARLGTTVAEAIVLYNNQEIEMPVRDGSPVEWADVEGIKQALGLDKYRNPIPAGYMVMSNGEEVSIELESDYLLGPEGAHLNIAGISGLATKTSYAMFLLNAVQQRLYSQVAMVIFNVKGSDLLRIGDEPEMPLTQEQLAEWARCALEAVPFRDVTYLYPYAKRPQEGYTLSHADPDALARQHAKGQAFNYIYSVEAGCRNRRLALLFSDIDDPNATMESIVHELPEMDVASWESLRQEVKGLAEKKSSKAGPISVLSWRRFMRLLETRTDHDLFTEPSSTERDRKRQVLLRDVLRGLRPGRVLVIDVEPLPDYLQCFVFGDVIQTLYGIKLGDEEGVDPGALGTVVVFADELNKYAPKSSEQGARTLTRSLLEITERGRSLGVILFGAQQFRSGVHDRILGNCSTNAYGRTSPVELSKSQDYRYLSESHRATLTRLTQGTLLVQHAAFRTELIRVRFPRPSYFQRKVR